MEAWSQLLEWLALPQFGLSTVLVVSFVSATLLPLGSEPAVFIPAVLMPSPEAIVLSSGSSLELSPPFDLGVLSIVSVMGSFPVCGAI